MKIRTIAIIFILVLLAGIFIIDYIEGKNYEELEFPDGCVEIWYKGELQSAFFCNEGRAMEAEGIK